MEIRIIITLVYICVIVNSSLVSSNTKIEGSTCRSAMTFLWRYDTKTDYHKMTKQFFETFPDCSKL